MLKLGGKACLIGPVYPTFWLSRFFADVWMLFPKEEEYIEWFEKAGFKDVQLKRIGPKWYRGVRRHGLIMGCSVTGIKPASGDSPLQVVCFEELCLTYFLMIIITILSRILEFMLVDAYNINFDAIRSASKFVVDYIDYATTICTKGKLSQVHEVPAV